MYNNGTRQAGGVRLCRIFEEVRLRAAEGSMNVTLVALNSILALDIILILVLDLFVQKKNNVFGHALSKGAM